MRCPKCGADTRVIETASHASWITRRRRCMRPLCATRFTTTELRVNLGRKKKGRNEIENFASTLGEWIREKLLDRMTKG